MAKKEDDLDVLLPSWSGAAAHGFSISGGDEGIFIKDVVQNSPAGKSGVMKEGDQIVSATIYFDDMGYEEAQKILQTVDRHTVGLKLHRKGEKLSPGGSYSWNPDRPEATSPDAILSGDDEDYQRIFRTKIKPRLKSEDGSEAPDQADRTSNVHITRKVITRTIHTSGPTVMTDTDIQNPEFKIKVPRYEQVTTERSGPKLETSEMDVDVNLPDTEFLKFQTGDCQRTTHTMHIVKTKVVEVTGPDMEYGQATFHMPQANIAGRYGRTVQISDLDCKAGVTNVKDPVIDINTIGAKTVIASPKTDADLNVSGSCDNLKGPRTDGQKLRMQPDGSSLNTQDGKLNIKTKTPNFSVSGSDINTNTRTKTEAPDLKISMNVPEADIKISGPRIESDVEIPAVDMNVGGGDSEIKSSNFNLPGIRHKICEPDFNLEGKCAKATVNVDVPDIKLETGIKSPTLNKTGFTIYGPKVPKPDIYLEQKGPNVELPDIKLQGDVKGLDLNTSDSKVCIKQPDIKERGLKFSVPSMNLPTVKTADIDFSLKGSKEKGDHGTDLPSANIKGEIKELKLDIKTDIPDTDIRWHSTDANSKGPKIDDDICVPDVDLNVRGGSAKIKGPDLKMPDLSISGPKIEKPDINLKFIGPKSTADVDATTVKLEGDLKGPDVNIEGPKVDIEGPHTKSSDLTFSIPAVGLHKVSSQGIDLNLKGPGVKADHDIDLPSTNVQGHIKGPKVDIDVPEADIKGPSGSFHIPKFKMPRFGRDGGKVEGPDVNIDANLPAANVSLTGPTIEGKIDTPDVDLDVGGGYGKIKSPKITMPDFNISGHRFGLKGPEVKGDHDIDLPSATVKGDIKGPKADIDIPGVDIKGSSESFHIPKFKKPTFGMSGGKLEGPDVNIDANLPAADVSLTGPKIEGDIDVPDVDLDVGGGSGKIKGPKLKMPDFNISGPKFEKPDWNLKFKGPKAGADVDVPDINLKGDLKGPHINIRSPKVDIEGPEANGSGFNISMPSMSLPKIKVPDIDLGLKGPEVKGEHDIDIPSAEIKGDIKGPKVDIDVPEADIKGPSGSFQMPKFKLPKFGFGSGKVEGPDVNIDANLPAADVSLTGPKIEGDVDVPDVDLDVGGGSGKIKGPKLKMADFNISGPKFEKPDWNLKFKGPKAGADVDIPDVNLEGDLKGPDVNIKGPKVDIEGPEAKGSGFNISMPSMSLPKIKVPDIDLGLKGREVKGEHDIDLPSADIKGNIKGPKMNIDVPEADIKGPSGSFHMPKFKMPKFGFGSGKVEGPDVNIESNLPTADVSLTGPKIEGDIDVPDVDLDVGGGSGKIKGPKLKMPDFNISGPKFEKPDWNLKFKGPKAGADVDVPDVNLEGDLKGPDVNIKGPKVDIEGPEAKGSGFNISMPSMSLPKIKVPDIDLGLKGPEVKGEHDIDLPSADIKGNIKGPRMNIDVPEADIKGPSGSFHMPKFKMPKFGFGSGKVEGPDVNIDSNLPTADVSLTGPKIEGDIDVPDVDLDVGGGSGKIKGPKLKMPDFNISGPKFEKPDWNLKFKGPKAGADVDVPDVNLEGDLKGPDVNIKGPKVDIEGPEAKGSGFNISMPSMSLPKIKVPDFDLSLKGPEVKGEHDIDLPSAEIKGDIKGPKVDIDVPEADIKGPSGSFHMPKFKLPKFGFGSGKVEGPDVNIDANLPAADVSLTGPKIEGDIDVPDVDLDVGGGSGKIKGPKLKMPDLNISGPKFEKPDWNLKFKGPKAGADVDVPDVNLEGGLKGPDVNIKGPKVDIEGPDAKGSGFNISMPSMSLPKIKVPDFDLSLKGPEVKGEHDIDLPSAEIKGDIKGPKVDIEYPEADIKGPSGSFHMPKFKLPKFGFGSGKVEGPDVNIDANLPAADVSLTGPKIEGDIDVPDVDLDVGGGSGKIKGPKLKMPDLNISGPKFEKPDWNLKFKGPKAGADVDVPDVNLEGGLKGPDVNIKGPKVDIEGPDAKGSGFNISMPSMSLPKIKVPDFDLSLKGPEVKGEHDIDLPSAEIKGDIKGPKVDIDVPEADIKGPSGSFHMPKFKLPKFGFGSGKVEGPDVNIDANLPAADVSLTGPKIEGDFDVPDVDLDVGGGSGKIKGPKLKMPDLNISGPKFEKPDWNLKFKGPKAGADVDVPDVNLKGDLKGPDVNIKGPKVDIEGPDAKGSGFNISMPSMSLPKIKVPDFDLSLKGPEVKGEHDIDLPSAEIKGDIKGPKVDIDVPEADIKGPSGSFHMPKFKLPKFGFGSGKVEGPDVNIDANLPAADVSLTGPKIEGDIDVPDVDLDVGGGSGKIKGPKLKMPDFNISGPKFEKPDWNLKFKGPKAGADVDVPDVNLEGGLKGPDVNIKGPKVDIEGPDAKGSGFNISMPSMSLPKIKVPDVDLSLKGPEVKGEHDIDLPSAEIKGDIKGPKVDIDVPEADIKGPSGSFHMPKFKMPKFGFGSGKVEGPDVNIDANLPAADVSLTGPKIEGDIDVPDVDLDVGGGSGKIKGPKLKMPDFNISGPKFEKPDWNLKFKGPKAGADVDVPDVNLEGGLKGPDVNIKGPKVDIEGPDAKGSGFNISMPSMSLPKIKVPDFDLSLKGPEVKGEHDIDLPSAEIKGDIKGPKVDIDVPEADIKGPSGSFHMPKFKMPKFGFGSGKVEGPDVNIDANLPAADVSLTGPKIEGDIDVPDVDLDVGGGSGKIKGPKLKMPDFNISGPKFEKPDWNLKFKGPKAGADVDVPDVNLKGDLKGPDVNIKGPKVDIEGPEAKGSGFNISMPSMSLPKIKVPDFDLSLKGPEVKGEHDIDLPSAEIKGDIKGPKVDIDVPEADIKGPSGSFHMPKFKMPKFGFGSGKVEGPDVNIDANLPAADVSLTGPKIEGDIDVPDVDLDVDGGSGKIKGPKLKMPDLNISGPKFEKPDWNLKFKGPKAGADVDVPDVNLKGDLKGPDVNIKGPKVDIEGPEAKGSGFNISMPSMSLPKIKVPDFDLSLKGPEVKGEHDIDLPSAEIKGDIKGPKVDIDVPEADIKGPSGSFHMPKFKMPKFGFGSGKVEGPDVNIDANLPAADVSLTGPKIEGDIDVPDVDLDVGGGSGKIKGPKLKMPDLNISGPKFEKPDWNLKFKGPKAGADVDVPDVNLEGDLKGPDVNIKGPKFDIEGSEAKGSGFKMSIPSIGLPKIKGPDFDLSLKGPDVKADLPSADMKGDMKGPKVNIDVPEADVKGHSGKFRMPRFKMSKFGIGGGKVEGPSMNIETSVPAADASLSGPKIEGDVDVPKVDVDIGGGSKIKGHKFKMPDVSLSGPKVKSPDFDIKLQGPKITGDVDVHEANLEGDLKGPNVKIKGPKMEGPDAKGSGFNISMPSIGLPKIKAPDFDLSLKGPEVKGKHDVDLPSAHIKGDIKGPKVDIDVPEADIKGPSGSFHMPKFKMPKFGFGSGKVEGPDVNIDANIPAADVSLTGPKIEGDIDVPDVDLDVGGGSGKIKGPKLKMPEFNLSGPKFQKPDWNLKFKGPKATADVDVPDVNLEGDLKGPDVNIEGPKVDIEGPEAKGSGFNISMPSMSLPKIKVPDFDLSLKGPEVKGEHDIDLPSAEIKGDIKGPKVDIDVPEADIKGPSGSFHMPKFKLPKFGFGGGKVEGPDVNIDANLPAADVSLTGPKIEGDIDVPDVDLDVGGGSGKVKGPKLKMPDFNISGPKFEKPDWNLKFKGPKAGADVDVPDVNLEGDLKGPDVNIKGPKVDIEGPDAKGSGFNISMPSMSLPKIKVPDFDLSLKGPEVKGEHDIDLPSTDIKGDIKGPKVDIDVPEADIKGPSGSFHMPKFKMPKFGFGSGKVEGPDVNIDANLPAADVSLTGPKIEGDIDVPDVDLDVSGGSGKIKGPKLKMPDFNISGPKFEKPDWNLKFKGPKAGADVDVPDVNLEGDLKGPGVNIKGPKVDIEGPDAKGSGFNISMPSMSLPKIKVPDFDLSLKGPEVKGEHDIDLPSTDIKGDIKGPKVDIDVPEADIKGPSGSFHMPKFKMPKFGFGSGKVEGPDVNIDANLPAADVSLTGPKIEGDIDVPDVDLDVGGGSGKIKGPKLKMPDFNISGPKFEKPDWNLKFKGSKAGADVDVPDVNLEGDLKGPDVNIKGPKVDIEGPDAKGSGFNISMPSMSLPKIKVPDFDLSFKGPEVKGEYDIDLPSTDIKGDIKGPKVDIDVPEADIKGPSGSFHMPKFKMPKFGFGSGKVEGPDVNIDANLPAADVSLTGPKIEGDIDVPDVDLDVGGGSGKIKGPKLKMPDFNISGPKFEKPDWNLKFKGPKAGADVDVPDVNLEGDLKGPDINIRSPKVDIEGPDAKGSGFNISMPSISLPKVKVPDFELGLKGPEVKGEHDIDLHSAEIKGDIKGPKVDIDVPEADIKGPSGSFHMPKFKMPKFGFGSGKVEGPDVNIDANLPAADVSLTGPKIEGDIDVPDVDLDVGGGSGKIKGPKLKMPDFNISGPKFEKPDWNLKFKGPKAGADVDVPDVNLEGDLKGPDVNIKGPKVDIEGPEAKGSGFNISMPSMSLPKIKVPDFDLSLKGPEVKGEHDIDLPSAEIKGDIKGPKVNIDVPEADIKGPSGSFHMPKFKLPKFGFGSGKVEGPDVNIDANLPAADVSLTGPKIEGDIDVPDVDLDVGGGSGKIKGPKLKMPDFNISGPKFEKPDWNLKFKGPKAAADVDVPDVNLEGDLKGPDINIRSPKVDIEGPDAKGSGFNISMPSMSLPKIKVPDFDLSLKGPEVKGEHDVDLPSAEIKGDIKGPRVDIDVPEADIKGPSGSFHMPKFKMPKFGFGSGKVEGPDVNIDANLPAADVSLTGPKIEGDFDVPDVDLDVGGGSGKIKGPKLKMPDFNISGPKFEKPDWNLKFKGPKAGADIDVPDVNLEGDLKGPDVNIKGPKVDIEGPDAKGSGFNISMPSMSLPKIKVPDFDLSLKGPEVKGEHDIDLPSAEIKGDIKGPKVDIDVPEADIKGPSGSFHMPKFKMPKFGFGSGKVEGPDVNIDANLPAADVSLTGPKIEGDIDVPDVDLDVGGGSGKIKGPKFKMPDFNISGPKFEKPDWNLKFKGPKAGADVDIPDVNLEGDLKGPDVNIKGPKVDIEGPEAKGSGFNISMPSMSLPKIKVPDFDLSLKGPEVKGEHDIDLPSAEIKGDIKGPKVDIDVPEADIKGPSGSFHMPKFKLPKFGFGSGKVEGPDVNIDANLPAADVSLTGPKIEGDIDVPDVDLDVGGGSGKIKGPKFKMPDFNISGPKFEKPDWNLKFKGPKAGADVDVPDVNLEGDLKGPDVNIKGPKVDIEGPEAKGSGFNISMPSMSLPKIKVPDLDLSLKGPEVKGEHDIDLPSAEIKGDIKGPKVDIDVTEANIKGPSAKFHMPKIRMPKFGFSGGKGEGPDVNIDARLPEADVDLTGPTMEGDLKMPDVDLGIDGGSGQTKGPKFKLPGFKISGPKVSKPDFDLELKGPKLSGDVDVPDVTLAGDIKDPKIKKPGISISAPKVPKPHLDLELKGPKVSGDLEVPAINMEGDIKGTKLDIDGPNVKETGAKFSMPSIHLPHITAPNIDLNFKAPKLRGDQTSDISSPSIEGEIKGPKIDVETPDINLDGAHGQFQMPKINMPTFKMGGPKLKGPELDIKANVPETDVTISGPKIKGGVEVADVDMDVDGKIKGPGFQMPGINISLPKLKAPNLDFGFKGPELSGGHGAAADINMEGDIKGSGFDIQGPKVNIKAPEMKIEGPDVKGNEGKVSLPSMGISAPNITSPDMHFDLKGPKLEGTADIKSPSLGVDVSAPEMDTDGQGAHLKLPKMKKPKFGFGIKGPQGDINAPSLDISGSDIDLSVDSPDLNISTKGKKGKFKMPKFNIKSKKPAGDVKVTTPMSELDLSKPEAGIKSPNLSVTLGSSDGQLNIKHPKVKKQRFGKMGKLTFPDVEFDLASSKAKGELPSSKIEGDLQAPSIDVSSLDIKGPHVDIRAPGVDVNTDVALEGHGFKAKGTKLKLPLLNIKSPKMSEPNLDINLKDANLKGEVSGDVKGPTIDIKRPEIDFDVEAPNVDIEKPESKLKMKIKKPKLNISGPKFKGSGVDMNVSIPKLDTGIKGPEVNIDELQPNISDSDLHLKGPSLKLPDGHFESTEGKLSMPAINISGTKLQGPDVNLDTNALKVGGDLRTPVVDVNLETPDVNINADGKFKGPKIAIPSVDISAPKMDLDSKHPQIKGDVNISSPNIKGSFRGPDVGVKGPNIDVCGADIDIKGGEGKLKMPQINLPKADINLAEQKVKGISASDFGVNVKGPKLEGSLDTDIKCPELDIKGPNVKMDTSNINIASLKGKGSSVDINVPKANVEFSGPKFEQDIKGDINVAVPDVNLSAKLKSPEVKLPSADVKFDAKGPTIKGDVNTSSSKIDLKSPELDVKATDISADIKAAIADLDVPLDKITIPKFKRSQFQIKGPNVESHHMATGVSSSGVQGPSVDIKGPQTNISIREDDVDGSGVKVKKGKIKMPKFNFSKSKGKGSIEGAEGEFSVSGPKIDIKGSKGSLGFSEVEVEGAEIAGSGKASSLDISTSPKSKSGTLDFSLFKGKKSERHRSSSLSDEHDLSPSSPKGRLDFGEGTAGAKGKKSKLKFGTFGGFGAKSKGSYEVTLGEGEAAAEGSGISLVSKKTRLSSSSSNESGSKAGFRLPKVELNINKNKE
ncbi:neuroblast differentiation-associated protein AHNAK [Chiloscyllium punctatum]